MPLCTVVPVLQQLEQDIDFIMSRAIMMMIVYAGIVDIMQYVLYLSTYTYICLFQCTHTVGVRRVFTLTYRDLKWGSAALLRDL